MPNDVRAMSARAWRLEKKILPRTFVEVSANSSSIPLDFMPKPINTGSANERNARTQRTTDVHNTDIIGPYDAIFSSATATSCPGG